VNAWALVAAKRPARADRQPFIGAPPRAIVHRTPSVAPAGQLTPAAVQDTLDASHAP
jgi:hypothetical protein